VQRFSQQVAVFSLKPWKNFGADSCCRFQEKRKSCSTSKHPFWKNDVTEPKDTLITGNGSSFHGRRQRGAERPCFVNNAPGFERHDTLLSSKWKYTKSFSRAGSRPSEPPLPKM